jgi:hypothetical protein
VFIDETWAKTNMTRRHGRCSRGARLLAKVPQARWRTLTFLAALRHDRITAPCVIDGPINGTSFRAYVDQFLVPTLRPCCAKPTPTQSKPPWRGIGDSSIGSPHRNAPITSPMPECFCLTGSRSLGIHHPGGVGWDCTPIGPRIIFSRYSQIVFGCAENFAQALGKRGAEDRLAGEEMRNPALQSFY